MHSIRLATTGSRTRELREVKLYAFDDGERLFVVGSGFAPGDRTPGWVHNLRTEPKAEIREGKATTLVLATEITDEQNVLDCGRSPARNSTTTPSSRSDTRRPSRSSYSRAARADHCAPR